MFGYIIPYVIFRTYTYFVANLGRFDSGRFQG